MVILVAKFADDWMDGSLYVYTKVEGWLGTGSFADSLGIS